MRRSFRKRLAASGAVPTLIGGLDVAAVPAAHAVDIVTCTGTGVLTLSPGVTLTPRPTALHADASFAPCVASDPLVTTATSSVTATGTLSCLTGSTTGTQRITWSDGSQSVVTFTGLVGVHPGGEKVAVLTGTVTGGDAFVGGTMAETLVFVTTQSLQCLTPEGIQSGGGPMTITITA
jgi:hypothetical protein